MLQPYHHRSVRYDVCMHKDATGRDIQRGDYIAYCVTAGSASGMKFGRVLKLKEREYDDNVYDSTTRSYNKVRKTKHWIQVISVDEKKIWDPATQTSSDKWVIQGKVEGKPAKAQSIERLERVVMLLDNQMHPEAKELLDKEMHERGL